MTIDDKDIEEIIGPELNGDDSKFNWKQIWNRIRIFLFRLWSEVKSNGSEIKQLKIEIEMLELSITQRIDRHSKDRENEKSEIQRQLDKLFNKQDLLSSKIDSIKDDFNEKRVDTVERFSNVWVKIGSLSGAVAIIVSLIVTMVIRAKF